jgi:DNA helicase-2/ATP-dependent DNA helicase PcrA
MAIANRTPADSFAPLNPQQLAAAQHGRGPLLIVAGAGTGKTKTLVHRVAYAINQGTDPARILLLTFTRRAAAEMLRRVEAVLRHDVRSPASLRSRASEGGARDAAQRIWGGTFHAIAMRLLRMYGKHVGLDPGFTIHDRSDSEDLIDVVRTELGFAKTDDKPRGGAERPTSNAQRPTSNTSTLDVGRSMLDVRAQRFPRKHTCMAIYSHCVNAQAKIEQVVPEFFPWCQEYLAELKQMFRSYVDRKEAGAVLDYDDLLLFWRELLAHPEGGRRVRGRFDCVLVDEYQDTNRLQADVLKLLCPDGSGLTVVGDDAQSIYSFRAASVRNILEFPEQFGTTASPCTVVKLEQNYRSTQPILRATNDVIACSSERYAKELWSQRDGGEPPWLVTCDDEPEQADFVVTKILEHREAGLALRQQAVLFRASHHSILLEGELARRNIPFVKYGGLKFMEAAHVKDLLAFLRLAENPRDVVAGTRVLTLLPGIGPARARQLMELLGQASGFGPQSSAEDTEHSTSFRSPKPETRGLFQAWSSARLPAAAREHWPKFVRLMQDLAAADERALPAQLHAALAFYEPLLREKHDHPDSRWRDLEQLELLAARFPDRRTMLAELTLDPPSSTQDFAGEPVLDEDYLILSTIHSAKGLEFGAVYVIHASDGNIPSDMATRQTKDFGFQATGFRKEEEDAARLQGQSSRSLKSEACGLIEEERRLFYVSLTRAKDWLYVCYPLRYYHAYQNRQNARYGLAKLTRFIPAEVQRSFQCHVAQSAPSAEEKGDTPPSKRRTDARQTSRALWT